jgi:hypothetical protein
MEPTNGAPPPPLQTPDHTHSIRLTFAYSGDDVRLVRTELVAMISPGIATAPPEGDQAGYWIEVRDAGGNLLYHRPLHDPLRRSVEVFGDEPGDPLYRSGTPATEGEFEVIVPDLPHAATFLLHGPPPEADSPHAASRELVTHGFDELRQGPGGDGERS